MTERIRIFNAAGAINNAPRVLALDTIEQEYLNIETQYGPQFKIIDLLPTDTVLADICMHPIFDQKIGSPLPRLALGLFLETGGKIDYLDTNFVYLNTNNDDILGAFIFDRSAEFQFCIKLSPKMFPDSASAENGVPISLHILLHELGHFLDKYLFMNISGSHKRTYSNTNNETYAEYFVFRSALGLAQPDMIDIKEGLLESSTYGDKNDAITSFRWARGFHDILAEKTPESAAVSKLDDMSFLQQIYAPFLELFMIDINNKKGIFDMYAQPKKETWDEICLGSDAIPRSMDALSPLQSVSLIPLLMRSISPDRFSSEHQCPNLTNKSRTLSLE